MNLEQLKRMNENITQLEKEAKRIKEEKIDNELERTIELAKMVFPHLQEYIDLCVDIHGASGWSMCAGENSFYIYENYRFGNFILMDRNFMFKWNHEENDLQVFYDLSYMGDVRKLSHIVDKKKATEQLKIIINEYQNIEKCLIAEIEQNFINRLDKLIAMEKE